MTLLDAVVLFWDSDVSDVDENSMTDGEIVQLRANYTAALQEVTQSVLCSGAYFILAGPEILGEGNLFLPIRFWNKDQMLDDYRTINQNVAESTFDKRFWMQSHLGGCCILCT